MLWHRKQSYQSDRIDRDRINSLFFPQLQFVFVHQTFMCLFESRKIQKLISLIPASISWKPRDDNTIMIITIGINLIYIMQEITFLRHC